MPIKSQENIVCLGGEQNHLLKSAKKKWNYKIRDYIVSMATKITKQMVSFLFTFVLKFIVILNQVP